MAAEAVAVDLVVSFQMVQAVFIARSPARTQPHIRRAARNLNSCENSTDPKGFYTFRVCDLERYLLIMAIHISILILLTTPALINPPPLVL
jgi:hypothetical protein